MSNIERRYAYLDEGVFPVEGEYGVTYLTLYSSNAGNTYDGWVYDPENKIEESLTERTYGYRNLNYPDYCWDDEVVVDLSNAQNRQESSEYVQGRITSFNTNVSDRPIVLQDIDITGMTEEQRENKATTVLFSAIPIVKDAYIQAQVEVQCKCNLSPDNTSGEMRIEAFYILNDESDRTMRPNPVHTFTVSSPNERHTLPWIYFNPALKHEDHNYIGVKLICTGGTAEIGISDNPDYGDAMITLISGGLNGDRIDDGKPVSLEIFGKEEVIGGYELKPEDYTVLCTYDTGEIYEVTRMCSFTPAMGTKILDPVTILTAYYLGLRASMNIRLGLVESIELIGIEEFHGSMTLELEDFSVFAFLDTGDVMDITEECTFNPVMGTIIDEDTTLVATYEPFWMTGQVFTSSLEIVKIGTELIRVGGDQGLVYTLYDDGPGTPGYIKVTGSAVINDSYGTQYDILKIPSAIVTTMQNLSMRYYNFEWAATGPICGVYLPALYSDSTKYYGFVSNMTNFDKVHIVPKYGKNYRSHTGPNPIYLNFHDNETITSDKLSFIKNIDMRDINNWPTVILNSESAYGEWSYLTSIFKGCKYLDNLDFLENIDASRLTDTEYMFEGCAYLENISGIKDWDVSNVSQLSMMFKGCTKLENASDLYKWYLPKAYNVSAMFQESGLTTLSGLGNMKLGEHNSYDGRVNAAWMFAGCNKLKRLHGAWNLVTSHIVNTNYMFSGCEELEDISAASDWITSNVTRMDSMFNGCKKLKDISAVQNWDTSEVTDMGYMFYGCPIENDGYVNNWNVSKVECFYGMFGFDENLLDDTGWSGSNVLWTDEQDRLLSDFKLTLRPYQNSSAEDRIEIYLLMSPQWQDPDGTHNYYITHSGMYAGRDLFRLKYSGTGAYRRVESFQILNELPWWYRTLLTDKVMNLKTVATRRYN